MQIAPLLAASLALLTGSPALRAQAAAAPKPNVLCVAIDELRPEIDCDGARAVQTPQLDRFASTSLTDRQCKACFWSTGAYRAMTSGGS